MPWLIATWEACPIFKRKEEELMEGGGEERLREGTGKRGEREGKIRLEN